MKRYIPIIATLLAIPTLAFASFTVPMVATSTATPTISPSLVNGVLQSISATYFTATSTSRASAFPYASTTALTVSGSSYLGSILSGTWGGTAIPFANGGTGLTSASDDTSLISNGSAWVASAIPNCTDVSGNHINYTAASNAWSCGTTSSGGGGGGGTDVNWSFFNNSGIRIATSSNQVLASSAGQTSTTTLAKLEVAFNSAAGGSIFAYGSTTLQNYTGVYSTTTQATTTNLAIPSIASALLLTNAGGSVSGYAGVTCTNQFLRALSALGASTCATVSASDVSLATLTAGSGLTSGGTYTGATSRTFSLDLTNPNTFTALQQFNGGASTTLLSATLMYKTGSFSIATTTAWAGTTTEQQLFTPIQAETWLGATCNTLGLGTVNVQFFNNSAKLNMIPASSTPAFFTFSTNNSIGALATTTFMIGTPASSPTSVTCTIKRLAPAN